MRDRFPLLVLGGLLLAGVLGTFLLRGAPRGGFADTLSTYRSRAGRRACPLPARRGERPARRPRTMADLRILSEHEDAGAARRGGREDSRRGGIRIRRGSPRIRTRAWTTRRCRTRASTPCVRNRVERRRARRSCSAHVRAGATLVYVPWGSRENPLLDALGVKLTRRTSTLPMRTLVPSQPTPYTLGVERVEAKVQALSRAARGRRAGAGGCGAWLVRGGGDARTAWARCWWWAPPSSR